MSVSKAYYSGSGTGKFLTNLEQYVTLTIWGGGGSGGGGASGFGGSGGTCTFDARGKTTFIYEIGAGGLPNGYNAGRGGFTKFTCGDVIITANGGQNGDYIDGFVAPSVSVTDPSNLISSRSFVNGATPISTTSGINNPAYQQYGMGGNGYDSYSEAGNPGILIVTYTVSQKTVNLPANVDEITVIIWGGGGGGQINQSGGWGGGGAKCVFNARDKSSYTFNIGLGGGGSGRGGNSTFSCGNFNILAEGGETWYDSVSPRAGSAVITDPSNLIGNRLKEIYTGGSPSNNCVTVPISSEDTETYCTGTPGNQEYGMGGDASPGHANPGEPGVFILTYTLQETVPGAPTSVIATAGGGQATVSWTEPENNGGSAIIDYTVTSSPGGFTATTSGTSATVTGLTGGTSYTFTVTARNSVGSSSASSPSNSVTIISFVYFSQPLSLSQIATAGGITTTSKKMSDLRGKTIFNTSGVEITVPASGSYNLSFFAAKTFRTPTTVPDPPTNLTPTAGDAQVSLSWTAPTNNGGEAITGYTVKYSNGTVITTTGAGTTSYTVTALTNGTSYTFIVTANNNVGSSAPSSSVSVTPGPPPNNIYFSVTEGSPSSLSENNKKLDIAGTGSAFVVSAILTGGNTSPIYISVRFPSGNGTATNIINTANYGNLGSFNVYFPYGIISGSIFLSFFGDIGSCQAYIRTAPYDGGFQTFSQDASGYPITWP